MVLAGALYGVFSARGRRARFTQVLAVVVHAGVILVLRDVVAAPLNYARESLASPLTLLQFFGMFDEASPLARVLAMIDLFMIWWLVVLAIGLAVLYRTRARTVAAGLLAACAGIALLLAGSMAALGGTGETEIR
jgi:hypothetical protein